MKEKDDAAADRYSTAAAHPTRSDPSVSRHANSITGSSTALDSALPERNPARMQSRRYIDEHDGADNRGYGTSEQGLGAGADNYDPGYTGNNAPVNGNAAAMVLQEMSKLKSLKRLSIGSQGSLLDPDLPFGFDWSADGEQSPSRTPSNSPRQHNETDHWNSPTGPAFNDLSLSEGQASELLWVPASVHPELAPNEWRSYVESRVMEIKANQQAKKSSGGSNGGSGSRSLSPSNSGGGSSRVERRHSREIADGAQFADGSNVLAARRRSAGGSDKTQRRQSILELSKQFQSIDSLGAQLGSQLEAPQAARHDKALPPLSVDTSSGVLDSLGPPSPVSPSLGASLKRSSALSRRRARPDLPRIRAMTEEKQHLPASADSSVSVDASSASTAGPLPSLSRAATANAPYPRAAAPPEELKRSVSAGVTAQSRRRASDSAPPAPEVSKLLSDGSRNHFRQRSPRSESLQTQAPQTQTPQTQPSLPQTQHLVHGQPHHSQQPRSPVQQQSSWADSRSGHRPGLEKENAAPSRTRPALGLRIDVGLAQQHRVEQDVHSATTVSTQQPGAAAKEPRSATEEKSIWRWLQKDKEKSSEDNEKPDQIEGALSPTAKAFNSLFKKKKEKPAKEASKIGPISAPSLASGSDFEAAAATAAAAAAASTVSPSAPTTPQIGSPVLGAPLVSKKTTSVPGSRSDSGSDSAPSSTHSSFSRLADRVSNRRKDSGGRNNAKVSKREGAKPHSGGAPAGSRSPNLGGKSDSSGTGTGTGTGGGSNITSSDAMQLPYQIPSHHQISDKSYTMMYHRFPLHIERAIYRLSHMKLSNPHRPLREQVLLSNFMYAYLNLINQGYQQEMIAKETSSDSEQDGSRGSTEHGFEQMSGSSRYGSPHRSDSDGGEYIYGDYGAVYDYEEDDGLDTSGSGSDNDDGIEGNAASSNRDMRYRPQVARAHS